MERVAVPFAEDIQTIWLTALREELALFLANER